MLNHSIPPEESAELVAAFFDNPKVIAVVGDTNSGKTNMVHWVVSILRERGKFNLYTYGMRTPIEDSQPIYSNMELETITNSVIVLDEVMSLWDLDDRKNKRQVENTLRLLHHNNNILVLCALPENLKKFLAAKVNLYIYKRCTIPDFINGSMAKRVVEQYTGPEKGSTMLALRPEEALFFALHFFKLSIPYIESVDSKKKNAPIILVPKNVPKNAQKTSEKTREKRTITAPEVETPIYQ